MSLAAVQLRKQRSKAQIQIPKNSNISTTLNIDQEQQGQPDQQQLKILKAMKLNSQEDHRYYASVHSDKAVIQFPPAAIKANAVALNILNNSDPQSQSNPSHPLSLASSSHLSIRSDYGEASLGNEEVQLCKIINGTNVLKIKVRGKERYIISFLMS